MQTERTTVSQIHGDKSLSTSERLIAYRYALDLTPAQSTAALSHVGARRFAFNHMLALVKSVMSQREAERSYGIPDELLTPPMDWSACGLRKLWNARKRGVAPWWAQNSKEAYADGCARLAAALGNWSKTRNRTRTGHSGFPRFASRRGRQSVTFTTGGFRVDDARHVVLPMLGRLKTFESTNKLTSRIEAGTARISRATLAYERGRWVVSFTVHQTIDVTPGVHTVTRPVGIDFGVKDLLVVADADGHEFERIRAPRHLAEAQRRLRALQRRAARQTGPYDSVTRKRQEASARWRRTQERITRARAGRESA